MLGALGIQLLHLLGDDGELLPHGLVALHNLLLRGLLNTAIDPCIVPHVRTLRQQRGWVCNDGGLNQRESVPRPATC